MDDAQAAADLKSDPNYIYITEEEQRSEWSYEATKELLKIYDEKSDLLDAGIITTQRKLWELTSKALAKKGFYYTGPQCENKWKALKRSYRNKLDRVQRLGSSKRPSPFEYEVSEILAKRPNESFIRSYTLKVDDFKNDDSFRKTKMNQSPGYSNDVKTEDSNAVDFKNVELVHEDSADGQTHEIIENGEPTYAVIDDTTQSALVQELGELKTNIMKHTKTQTQILQQVNEVQEKIVECLEKTVQGQEEAREIDKKRLEQQDEIVEQMKMQNELLEKLIERLS
ncbi:hypothetical protein NQ315_001750 [Exocentrus adspersus]|uniref:Myb-like domain-containing protein n=1 Tax=Exocentrus adspersus TaxID=1586481 RepID=A0AAV8WAD1_9CUCU|nr:hypothetical protein NQ315_001750 [Exocentrus adspersus]